MFLIVLDVSSIIKRVYSLNIHLLLLISTLNPDCSICMNWRNCPWLSQIPGLCFAEDTIVPYKYFLTILVIIINSTFVFTVSVTIGWHCLCSPIFFQSAMNRVSTSMSRPIIAVSGEAFKYYMVGKAKCDMFCLIERHWWHWVSLNRP